MTISARRVNTMCNDNATTMKRWAPFSPPDKIDVADATVSIHRSKKCARSWR